MPYENSGPKSYNESGVDITAGYKSVELIKKHILKTCQKGAISEIGGFGGMFEPDLTNMEKPVLVSGTDGVGTKLKLAFLMDKHDTIGIDCVAMCVNDIICCGAKPMFFLDYIACGKNIPEKIEKIVSGIAKGCVQAGCSLIGGETAEMPGFYSENEYDLAGFSVGIVEKEKIIKKEDVKEGDIIIALASSGVHSNGFSLVRKIFNTPNIDLKSPRKELNNKSIGETLLMPTKIYANSVLRLIKHINVKSISHITGGGFYENIPRAIPSGLCANIKKSDIKVPGIFNIIKEKGAIPEKDMFGIFNMGVGMCIIVSESGANKSLDILRSSGEDAYIIGEIIKSNEKVVIY
ncbi:MAG: phosphoribosylformylglycinamidine cyclo-ligase [Oscillospiraceae bacterium]|jgi:phosphoribosylformylglycinamidine cyclo-ligase|nr:phosphoribosylformylglycinamidine cyclo-ligase [Oscillospiraceae bacterium]